MAQLLGSLATMALSVGAHRGYAQDRRPRSLTSPEMPASWIQLRNGNDNSGAIAGVLTAQWTYKAKQPVRGMSVAGGTIVLGMESVDADGEGKNPDQSGRVVALDVHTGRELWSVDVPSWVHGDVLIHKGIVVVDYGRWPMIYPGGVGALSLASGKPLWSMTTVGGIMPAPALDTMTGTVFAAGGDGVLYGINLESGKLLSEAGLRSADAMSSPRLPDDSTLVLCAGNSVTSYDRRSGRVRWRFQSPEVHSIGDIPPAIGNGIVVTTATKTSTLTAAFRALPVQQFVALLRTAVATKKLGTYRSWFQQQWLLALEMRTGHVLWRRPLGFGLEVPRNTSGTPVIAGNMVVVSSPVSKRLAAFQLSSGENLWTTSLRVSHKGAVTVNDSVFMYGDKEGVLHRRSLRTGNELGSCKTNGAFTPLAPIVVGKTVIFATHDGSVQAIPLATLSARTVGSQKQCT